MKTATRVVTHENLPADAGLSSLGVLMRLGGGIGLWIGVYGLVLVLLLSVGLGVIGLLMLGVGRSILHGRAGKALWAGRPGAVRLAWAYVAVGLIHSLALVGLIESLPMASAMMLYLLVGLSASWPLVVAGLLLRPSARAVAAAVQAGRRRILPEDLGITGVAALMVAMGSVGMVLVGLWMLLMVQVGTLKAGFFGWMALMIGAGFKLRSFLHLRSGFRFLRRFDPQGFRAANDQYFLVSLLTTVVVCLLMLFGAMASGIVGLVMILPVAGFLMTWPLVVRDVGSVELRPELEDDEAPPIHPARDQGLVMLGMVFLAYGVFSLCGLGVLLMLDVPEVAEASPFALSVPEMASWQGLLTTATTLWAGVELVGMSPRRKLAVAANLAVVAVMTAMSVADTFNTMEALVESPFGGRKMLQPQLIGITVGQLVGPLALPVVAAVQALRKPPVIEVNVDEVF